MAVAAAVVAFGVCLWAARSVSWGWLPSGDAERWGVAAAFAAVVAGAVGAAVGWWAGREPPAGQPQSGRSLRARATGRGRVDQAGGHRGRPSGPSRAAPERAQLDAEASGQGRIRQTGGDDYRSGPDTP